MQCLAHLSRDLMDSGGTGILACAIVQQAASRARRTKSRLAKQVKTAVNQGATLGRPKADANILEFKFCH
jgi:hypothetical protein